MNIFYSLNKRQKQSIGLIQIGTFLEYFDLFLYIHMTVYLNELFFPETDPNTKALLTAFALCSSLAFRPVGALIFGWMGDRFGRRIPIIITTSMMAISCIIMASLPTYDQIGISAAWIMIMCRIFQGISSMGEIVGANIYITEMTTRPLRFPLVAFMDIIGNLGQTIALSVVLVFMTFGINWRFAFWMGAIIAIVGAFARTRLLETPEFLKTNVKKENKKNNDDIEANNLKKSKKIILVLYFFISCGTPLWFYLGFFHFIPTLINNFGYTTKDILIHNFVLSVVCLLASIVWTLMSCRVHPLKILKIRSICSFCLIIVLPFLIMNLTNSIQLLALQSLMLILSLEEVPAAAIFLSYIPVHQRFTYASLIYSFARALTYISTSFGMIYFTKYFSYYGIWVVTLPIIILFLFGIAHFEKLERQNNLYPNLS